MHDDFLVKMLMPTSVTVITDCCTLNQSEYVVRDAGIDLALKNFGNKLGLGTKNVLLVLIMLYPFFRMRKHCTKFSHYLCAKLCSKKLKN